MISQGLADVEEAIRQHPHETASLYEKGRRAFLEGQATAKTDWSRSAGLPRHELALICHYLLASAFIAAWDHVSKDRTRRDQATSPACLLVSGLGLPPEDVLHRLHAVRERLANSDETEHEVASLKATHNSGCTGAGRVRFL
jgi:hypothetical protein